MDNSEWETGTIHQNSYIRMGVGHEVWHNDGCHAETGDSEQGFLQENSLSMNSQWTIYDQISVKALPPEHTTFNCQSTRHTNLLKKMKTKMKSLKNKKKKKKKKTTCNVAVRIEFQFSLWTKHYFKELKNEMMGSAT